MHHFTPAYKAREVGVKSRAFVRDNMDILWEIFKPLAPYIIGLLLLDLIITLTIMPIDADTGDQKNFNFGGVITNYFYTCLVISWHRVVIHGPDRYKPMNPFKPEKRDLAFIGMGILIFLLSFLISFTIGFIGAFIQSTIIMLLLIPVTLASIYYVLKICFYFPAKATGGDITLKQAYQMSHGYIWKLITAHFFSSWRVTAAIIGFALLAGIIIGIVKTITASTTIAAFVVIVLPMTLYFQPILTVLGVTVLSNYYQHAMRWSLKSPQPASSSPLTPMPEQTKDGDEHFSS